MKPELPPEVAQAAKDVGISVTNPLPHQVSKVADKVHSIVNHESQESGVVKFLRCALVVLLWFLFTGTIRF